MQAKTNRPTPQTQKAQTSQTGYRILNKGNKTAEILLYEDIGEGWFGGVSAKQFADDLKELGDLETLGVRINSPGGSVFEGVTIYNQLIANNARVTVHIDGLAASIASVIAMAGDEIEIADNALMMIHDPWTMAIGSAEDLRKEADVMDTIRGTLLDTYVSRTTSTRDDISAWMADETWMNADEAISRGFADRSTEAPRMAASVDCSRYRYRKNPDRVATPMRDGQRRTQILRLQRRTSALKTA